MVRNHFMPHFVVIVIQLRLTLYYLLFFHRVLDIEIESEEDEDTIIEKRRQMRRNIEQKYQYVNTHCTMYAAHTIL